MPDGNNQILISRSSGLSMPPLVDAGGVASGDDMFLVDVVRMSSSGGVSVLREPVAEEVPVAFVYDNFAFAVMMATPRDLEDFAAGFTLTEKIVEDIDEILDVRSLAECQGVELRVSLLRSRWMALRERHPHSLLAGSSCGLCGARGFDEALRHVPPVASREVFDPRVIWSAMAELPSRQKLNQRLGAVHAAAFFDVGGSFVAVREDIGRHNALDKLIGHLARHHIDPARGFVAVSSRCSYEMVHKTAAVGIPMIASVSAPSSKGIELATACGVGLAAFARDGRFSVYACPERFVETSSASGRAWMD